MVIQFRFFAKYKIVLIISLFGLIAGLGVMALVNNTNKNSSGVLGTSNSNITSIPQIGTNELLNNDVYEKAEVTKDVEITISPTSTPTPSLTIEPTVTLTLPNKPTNIVKNVSVTSLPTITPMPAVVIPMEHKIEKFAIPLYGFSLEAITQADLGNLNFTITHKDDTLSDIYIINLAKEAPVDKDGKPLAIFVSELYLFDKGIKKIDFSYPAENGGTPTRNFTVKPISFINDVPAQQPIPKTYSKLETPDSGITTLATSNSANDAEFTKKFMALAGLTIITRDQYGVPADNIFAPGWTPPFYDVNRIVVHHTATSIDLNNPANTVKAIWQNHTYTNDWGDIGYNYLIDQNGVIYEGRAGINGIRGNHAPPNEGAIGISLLGDYSNQLPTQATIDSLTKLMSYLSVVNNIPFTYKTSFDANNSAGIYPHRAINATSCPGNKFMTILPNIVTLASNYSSNYQTAKNINSNAVKLITNTEFVKRPNIVEVLINSSNLTPAIKTKLLNPSPRMGTAFEIDNTIVYQLKEELMTQFMTEVNIVAPDAKAQPNFIYKKTGWTEVPMTPPATNRSIPDDFDISTNNTHWNLNTINAPEAWNAIYNGPAGGFGTIPAAHGGTDNVIVAVLDTGVAYEDYLFDAGTATSTYKIYNPELDSKGIDLPYYTNSDLDGIANTGFERNFGKSAELNSANFLINSDNSIFGYDASMEYICELKAIDGRYPCNSIEDLKKNHGNDDDGHGTFVTSIIVASTGINEGETRTDNIVGIASNIKIIPIKVFFPNDSILAGYQGKTTSLILKKGVEKAILKGAHIINMSFGGPCDGGTCTGFHDDIFEQALNDAYDNHDILLVAASGNIPNEGVHYPASLSKVIAVGASNSSNARANYSSYGPELDLVAPVGDDPAMPNPNGGPVIKSNTLLCSYPSDPGCSVSTDNIPADRDLTQFFPRFTGVGGTGTSFSAPQVSAAAALLKSNKSSLTRAEIMDRLIYYATDIGPAGRDDQTGYGNLNIYESLKNYIWPNLISISPQRGYTTGGTVVTLIGTGFQVGSRVYFGNTEAVSVEFVDENSVKATSPVATNKDIIGIKIVNPNSNLHILPNSFTYVPSRFSPELWYRSGVGNWSVNNAIYSVSGDFNGDGFDEIASMYDYGSNDMGINVFSASGSTFTWTQWYRSGKNMWGVAYTKYLTAGDYNNDGKDEITAMYDYGNNNMGLNVFSASGSTFTWNRWYLSGPNNWGVPYTKFVTSGDYNEDGKSEIAAMYDYGSNNMGLNVFSASGSTFTWNQWYLSGKGNWGVSYTKFVTSGDFNDDGKDEITAMYDYGSNNMGLNVFSADPITPNKFIWDRWYLSGTGNWGVPYTKFLSAGDFNDDGKDEITAMYDYGSNNMGLNVFSADPIIPNKFIWNRWYLSGSGNWSVLNTKYLTANDFNNDGFDEVATMYDYVSNNMGIHVFTPY